MSANGEVSSCYPSYSDELPEIDAVFGEKSVIFISIGHLQTGGHHFSMFIMKESAMEEKKGQGSTYGPLLALLAVALAAFLKECYA